MPTLKKEIKVFLRFRLFQEKIKKAQIRLEMTVILENFQVNKYIKVHIKKNKSQHMIFNNYNKMENKISMY
jgi:hypothetical protein